MRRFVLVLVATALTLPLAAAAQQVSTITKDNVGLAVIQRTSAVMGSALGVSDVVCTGTLTMALGQNQTVDITLKSKGTQMTRAESVGPKGTIVRVVSHGTGVIKNPDGSTRKLHLNNTFAERVSHIPALSLLSEALGPNVRVESQTAASVNGAPNDVFALSYSPDPTSPQLSIFLSLTRMLFFVDQNTNLVSKVQFIRFSENGHFKQKVEREFSDYRLVGPILIPFKQLTYVDNKLETTLNLTSARVNVGLSDAEFTIPQ